MVTSYPFVYQDCLALQPVETNRIHIIEADYVGHSANCLIELRMLPTTVTVNGNIMSFLEGLALQPVETSRIHVLESDYVGHSANCLIE